MMPLATTRVTIDRPDPDVEQYAVATTTRVAANVRAHISAPSGRDRNINGTQELVDAVLFVDTDVDVAADDQVTDTFGAVFRVVWTFPRTGLGLDHIKAGMVRATGQSGG